MTSKFNWSEFESGNTIGGTGSENGVILRDEEHDDGARITLEQGGRQPFAITCGIYGLMVHTAFASSEPEAVIKFEAMKRRLEVLLSELDADTSDVDDALEAALDAFCDDFI